MRFDDYQLALLKQRYLFPGETPAGMFRRVARYIGVAESETLMNEGKFMPNSPTLMNAGREGLSQLSACFVLPIYDSIDSIYDTLKHTAKIHQSGGGTGFNFSNLRPKGDLVSRTKGVASGPVSFLRVYDVGTEVVKQGGLRRGANMGMLRVNHPDIRDFLVCKTQEGQIRNFNISVSIDDKFMDALQGNHDYDLINPRTGEVWETVGAREIWDKMIAQTWNNGEPGFFFVDTVNKFNPHPDLGKLETCNPCGETPLLPYESCVLGSVNLANHVLDDGSDYDWEELEHTVRVGVEFLNNVIDRNQYPLPEIEQATKRTNKIGLGVMGWADSLIKLGIRYDDKEVLKLADQVMGFIQEKSHDQSDGRNMTVTTIAPTGSISIICNCSSGIEPNFAKVETRNQFGTTYTRKHPLLGQYDGDLFVMAHDVTWAMHVAHQATFQKHVDNAISKTINLPATASMHEVEIAVRMAYNMGCKGVTLYRDRSRKEQVIVKECEHCSV